MDVSERRTVLKMAGSRIPGNAILIYFNIESESDEVSLVYIGLHHQLTNSETIQPITTEQSHCRSILGFSQKVHSYSVPVKRRRWAFWPWSQQCTDSKVVNMDLVYRRVCRSMNNFHSPQMRQFVQCVCGNRGVFSKYSNPQLLGNRPSAYTCRPICVVCNSVKGNLYI